MLAGNAINGPLACNSNSSSPTNLEAPNRVSGPRTGQCAKL